MERGFPLFAQLPPEIRQHVWRLALAQRWAVTSLKRHRGRVRLVGAVPRAVPQSCREARAVMQASCAHVDGLGWLDFARHLFFFRDARADRGLMMQQHVDVLARVQHMVLNPRDWPQLWHSLAQVKTRCPSLRSLVLVGPWFEPPAAAASYADIDQAPWEDWSPLFRGSPTELDVAPLLDALEHGRAANAAWMAAYAARLDRAARLLPDGVDEIENVYSRTRAALRELEETLRAFPNATPSLQKETSDAEKQVSSGLLPLAATLPDLRARLIAAGSMASVS
ncbi:hypothetical protein HRG_000508 [Hirsutella rhossiliensis]|uniref:2EXR domain-containing protein n=1 Tax=Hirsutella rhossiliensis TaxID=111463 RepID=A0A9P8SP59_9HYPO|nr:uncharacterized protein HRG_00508 [Hirsutella rhossiliensis]KAH0967866.1 hypothetical protein HRG_00508 [Hirsutella rhossiliensis]